MSLKNTIISIAVVFIAALIFTEKEPKPYAHWEYNGDLGQKNWSKLDKRFQMCENGLNQSPINITRPIDASLTPLVFEGTAKATKFINNGHSLQVDFQSGNYVSIDDKKYGLKQINFHTPSENQINGKSFPMEAQLIHADSNNDLAVIAVMFQEGDDNIVLNKLLRNLPEKAHDQFEIKSEVIAYEILPLIQEYYKFNGSLTTPPCTEGVKWIVMKEAVKISSSQLKDFSSIMHKNARNIQKLNARIILE
jgi:carbonic anhydrase